MATEVLYATSHLAGTFTNPTNAVGNTPTTWAGDLNTSTNATSRWAIGDPVDPLTSGATQTVRVSAKKGSNSGTPTIALNLYENGVLVQSILAATNVTSTTGQVLTGTFLSSAISNRADVEIEVVMTAAGGGPSVRNSAQIAYIEWTADVTAPIAPTSASITATSRSSSGIQLDWSGNNSPTSYLVEVSNDGSTGWTTLYSGSAVTYLHEGLPGSTTRYYRVTASNSAGSSPVSTTSSATTNAKATAPTGTTLYSSTFTGTDGTQPSGWSFETSAQWDLQENSLRGRATGTFTDERAIPSGTSHTDIEILVRVRLANYPVSDRYITVSFRSDNTITGTSASATTNAYGVEWGDTQPTVRRWINGADAVLGSFPSGDHHDSAYGWKWLRILVAGTAIKARIWPDDGTAEPSTWDVEVTDSNHSSGVVRLQVSSGAAKAADVRFDDLYVVEPVSGASRTATAAALGLTPQVASRLPGAVSRTPSAPALTLAAQVATVSLGTVARTATAAALALAPQVAIGDNVGGGNQTATAATASLTLSAAVASAVVGVVTRTPDPIDLTLAAQSALTTLGAVTRTASAAVLVLTAAVATQLSVVERTASPADLTLQSQTAARAVASVSRTASAAALVLTASSATRAITFPVTYPDTVLVRGKVRVHLTGGIYL